MSLTILHMQSKLYDISKEASKIGLKINDKKTKIMKTNCQHTGTLIMNGLPIDEVSDFCCLGNTLSTDVEVLKEINITITTSNFEMFGKQEKYRTK